jgi:hypothetical protein
MPGVEAHRDHAKRSLRLLEILRQEKVLPEWVIIGSFIKALHYVEALFACDSKIKRKADRHSPTHYARTVRLANDNRYRKLFTHYDPLRRMSERARYLDPAAWATSTVNPQDDTSFTDIWDTYVLHHLTQIRMTVQTLAKKYAAKNLQPVFDFDALASVE